MIGEETFTGKLSLLDDVIQVDNREFARSEVVSIVPGEPSESNYWSAKASFGATLRRGNTEQTDVTIQSHIWRRTASTRLTLAYIGSFGEVDGEETINNQRASETFDIFLTRRVFVTPTYFELFKDRFANIDYRATPATGGGMTVVDRPSVELDLALFGGYRYTRFDSVPDGRRDTDETVAAIGQTTFDWEINDDVDFIATYRADVSLKDIHSNNHHTVLTLSVEMTRILDLNVSFIWDRIGDPETEKNGDQPDRDDYRLVVGVEIAV